MGSIKGETDPFQYMVKYHTSLNSICQSPRASSKNFTIRKLRSWVRWGLLINWGSFELIYSLFILNFFTTNGSRSRCSNRGIQIQNNNGDYFYSSSSLSTIIYQSENDSVQYMGFFSLELRAINLSSAVVSRYEFVYDSEQSFFCSGAYAT